MMNVDAGDSLRSGRGIALAATAAVRRHLRYLGSPSPTVRRSYAKCGRVSLRKHGACSGKVVRISNPLEVTL
jgi:hypothetical protein